MNRFAALTGFIATAALVAAESSTDGQGAADADILSFWGKVGHVISSNPVTFGAIATALFLVIAFGISRRAGRRATADGLRQQAQAEDDVELSLEHDRELRNRIVRQLASARQRIREAEIAAGDALPQETRKRVRDVCDRIESFGTTVESAEHGNARRFKEGKLPDSALATLVDFTRTLDAVNHDVDVEATGLAGALGARDEGQVSDHCKQVEKVMAKLSDKFSERLDYLRGI